MNDVSLRCSTKSPACDHQEGHGKQQADWRDPKRQSGRTSHPIIDQRRCLRRDGWLVSSYDRAQLVQSSAPTRSIRQFHNIVVGPRIDPGVERSKGRKQRGEGEGGEQDYHSSENKRHIGLDQHRDEQQNGAARPAYAQQRPGAEKRPFSTRSMLAQSVCVKTRLHLDAGAWPCDRVRRHVGDGVIQDALFELLMCLAPSFPSPGNVVKARDDRAYDQQASNGCAPLRSGPACEIGHMFPLGGRVRVPVRDQSSARAVCQVSCELSTAPNREAVL